MVKSCNKWSNCKKQHPILQLFQYVVNISSEYSMPNRRGSAKVSESCKVIDRSSGHLHSSACRSIKVVDDDAIKFQQWRIGGHSGRMSKRMEGSS